MEEKIFKIASEVSTPLALAGVFAAVFFFTVKQIISKNIFPKLTAHLSASVIKLIVRCLFILTLVALILGFLGFVWGQLKLSPKPSVSTEGNNSPVIQQSGNSNVINVNYGGTNHPAEYPRFVLSLLGPSAADNVPLTNDFLIQKEFGVWRSTLDVLVIPCDESRSNIALQFALKNDSWTAIAEHVQILMALSPQWPHVAPEWRRASYEGKIASLLRTNEATGYTSWLYSIDSVILSGNSYNLPPIFWSKVPTPPESIQCELRRALS